MSSQIPIELPSAIAQWISTQPPKTCAHGRNASEPLKVHVVVATPNTSPKIVCHRFWPR